MTNDLKRLLMEGGDGLEKSGDHIKKNRPDFGFTFPSKQTCGLQFTCVKASQSYIYGILDIPNKL